MDALLDIHNLHASIDDKAILRGLNLRVGPGEIHAIMGPNGSGKSTLAQVLTGHQAYTTTGTVHYKGADLLAQPAEVRARNGVFLAFQYPVEIPGVNNTYFLRAALNAKLRHLGRPEIDAFDFLTLVKEKMRLLQMDPQFLKRPVNEGFSGGEKKRNEILQMAILEPDLAILDETDSGLDIDALRIVADGVNRLRSTERSMLVVTHYQRLLDYIVPDYVHVLAHGQIVRSGDRHLALELEEKGYGWIDGAQTPSAPKRSAKTTPQRVSA
jgi:Fe-S cluster assembly ATP-binding protein